MADKVIAITSDNGQNIYNTVKEQLKIPFPFACFSHTVHLAVDKAMEGRFISPLMAKAKRVVKHFKKSGKSTMLLRKAQIALGRKESEVLELIQPKSVVDHVTHELRLYMDELVDAKVDAVQYWQYAQPRYPMLTKIAFALLSIPATFVPCERIFSRAGFLVDDLRSSLKSENVNQMIFLNCNKDL